MKPSPYDHSIVGGADPEVERTPQLKRLRKKKTYNSDLVADKTDSEKRLRNGTLTPNPASNTSRNNEVNWLNSRFPKLEQSSVLAAHAVTVIVSQFY